MRAAVRCGGRLSEAVLGVKLGDADVGEAFFEEAGLKGLLDVVFAVNDKQGADLFGVLAGEELAEVFVVAVGAHAADAADLGVDLVADAEDVDLLRTGHEAAAEGMGFAVADEEDGVTAVADIVLDMVLDATGIGHPAGRDDDEGFVAEVEELGLVDGLDVF